MSSTVTTTTVTVVTTAVSTEVAATFSLVAVLLLGAMLMGREMIHFAQTGGARRLARGLDIAVIPLLLAFAVISAIGLS